MTVSGVKLRWETQITKSYSVRDWLSELTSYRTVKLAVGNDEQEPHFDALDGTVLLLSYAVQFHPNIKMGLNESLRKILTLHSLRHSPTFTAA